jgi:hypothetical protein
MTFLNDKDYKIEKSNTPFDHYIIDNFFLESVADGISGDFLDGNNDEWFNYLRIPIRFFSIFALISL